MNPMPQQILELNQNERKWIQENLDAIQGLLLAMLGEQRPDWLTPAHLDEAYSAWHAAHNRGAEDPNPMINAFGIAFGQYLTGALGLEWKVVSDDLGTEIAVYGRPGDSLVFPANLVAKRFEKGETGFFEPLSVELKGRIEALRKDAH
jgi:hypothetical protein